MRIFSGLRTLASVLALTAMSGFAQNAFAITTLPTSGICAFVLSQHYPFVYLYGANPGNGWGLSVIGTINFGTSTINGNVVLQNPQNGLPLQETQQSGSGTFTLSPGPIPGSSTLTSTNFVQGVTFTINMVAVNNGNTILMQPFNSTAGSQDAGTVGVCQM